MKMKTFKGLMEIISKDVKDDLKYMDSEAFSKKHGKKKNELRGFEEDANMTLDAQINEVLSKDASAGEYIHDFVHSDNPKFAGKSKEERKKQALAAYYAQKNEGFVAEGKDPTTDAAQEAYGFQRGVVKKNKDGSHVATSYSGSRKIFKSEMDAKAHANSGKEDAVDEGFKAKVAGIVGGVVGLGGLGAGAYHLDKQTPHANINGEKISIAPKNVGHTPPNAKIMTDKDGKKYHVYHHRTSVNRPGHTFATPVDEGFERSSSEFLKKHKDEMEKNKQDQKAKRERMDMNLKNYQAGKVRASDIKEAKEKTEYDYEGDMARGQLQSIINNAQKVHDMLEDNDNLPEWVQSKITLSEDYISTVANYMMSELDEEIVQEGRPSQQHPLEGHPYHKKTNAELEYISKDARAAGEAMKSHGTESGRAAENKYADQANDSATVRHFRKTSGMPSWYKKKYDLNESELEESHDVNHGSASIKAPGTGTKLSFLNKMYPNKKKQPNGAEFAAQRRVNRIADNGRMDEEKKSNDEKTPFAGPYKKTTGTVTDKSGAKHSGMSIAKDLARKALKRVSSSMVQKEQVEKSSKAKLIKKISKGKESPDKFQAEPELSKNTASGRNSYTDT